MKLPKINTNNIFIGNIIYFENKIGKVMPSKYLVIKTKKNNMIALTDDEEIENNINIKLGLTLEDNSSLNKYYLINSYKLSEKIKSKKLSLSEVVEIAFDISDFEKKIKY